MPARDYFNRSNRKQTRLIGIDLIRGLALLGVVVLHSGNSAPATINAAILQAYSSFAVPFFLATSFYLSALKFYLGNLQSFSSRFYQLGFPYLTWTCIYILFNIVKNLKQGTAGHFIDSFSDPVKLLLLGGPGYHLYFVPLLLSGTILFIVISRRLKSYLEKRLLIVLLAILIIFTSLNSLIVSTGNGFSLDNSIAFSSIFSGDSGIQKNYLVRSALIIFSWIFRCIPYILISLLITNPIFHKIIKQAKVKKSFTFLLIIVFCIVSFPQTSLFNPYVTELLQGWLAVFIGISISNIIKNNQLLLNFAQCSFGIYLVHLIIVDVSKSALVRLNPTFMSQVSSGTLLTVAIPSFLLSWATVFILRALMIKKYPRLRAISGF